MSLLAAAWMVDRCSATQCIGSSFRSSEFILQGLQRDQAKHAFFVDLGCNGRHFGHGIPALKLREDYPGVRRSGCSVAVQLHTGCCSRVPRNSMVVRAYMGISLSKLCNGGNGAQDRGSRDILMSGPDRTHILPRPSPTSKSAHCLCLHPTGRNTSAGYTGAPLRTGIDSCRWLRKSGCDVLVPAPGA